MTRFMSRMRVAGGVAAVIALMSVAPVAAQPMMGPGGYGWGPGVMMGPGMMGRGYSGAAMCDPGAAGMAAWRIDLIERTVQPAEAQRTALDALKDASKKAADTVATTCPRDYPASPTARLETMEKRLEAMLQAVKIVRPAFDAFYATLSDEQKSRLDAASPGRRGWRMWRWR